MARMMESVATINSLMRTLIFATVVGAGGWGIYLGYQATHRQDEVVETLQGELDAARGELVERDAKIGELEQNVADQQREIERLDTAMRLLKVDHRLAQLTVLDQQTDPKSGQLTSKVEFVEVNDEGQPIDKPRTFTLKGDVVYVDYWVVKFDDKYVEQADLDRSTSICLFRRIFGEHQEPYEGFVLDAVGSRPTAYARGGQMSDFERRIWDDFWNIANNPGRARELGIRAAHGEAVSIKLRPGMTYRLQLRASAGLTITPEAEAAPAKGA